MATPSVSQSTRSQEREQGIEALLRCDACGGRAGLSVPWLVCTWCLLSWTLPRETTAHLLELVA